MMILLSILPLASATTLWWLGAGSLLLLALSAPDPALPAMGIAAFLIGLLILKVSLPALVQVFAWGILSTAITLLLRWFVVPKQRPPESLSGTAEARTLTPIQAGYPGQVFYEGTSWSARCEVLKPGETIGAERWVYVVGREGNTLVVVPLTYFDAV
ncbi:NfeD family protein [Leptolyngbya sp. FACHB-261]|uniref:NfeD family protein n=1 Tax=Leptolyngbya sp. FACHB-261 TaxID=2692806 RepID=UPI001685024B|nr:NfeD family protein [Leptolyngbya sp. FACHB-261]MBD2103220.1 NfeD family protein [Leptolyngbya sp. FACHB-261]